MHFDGELEIGTVSGTLYHIAGNNRSNDGEDLCVCRLCVCVFLQLILFSDAFCATYQKGAIHCHPVGIMAPFSFVLFFCSPLLPRHSVRDSSDNKTRRHCGFCPHLADRNASSSLNL